MAELPYVEATLNEWVVGLTQTLVSVAMGFSYVMPGMDEASPVFMIPASPELAEKIAGKLLGAAKAARQQQLIVDAARKVEGQATVIAVQEFLEKEKPGENQS